MEPEVARRVMHHGYSLLYRLGVTWWVSAGTVLGAYRDGLSDGFLEMDTDIDCTVLVDGDQEQMRKQAAKVHDFFAAHKYDGFRVQEREDWGVVQHAFKREGIIFDIYYYKFVEDECIVNTECGQIFKPRRFVDPPGSLEIDGHLYPCPQPVEAYLAHRFGESWKTPRKKKQPWAKDTAALRPIT